ncbi:MAG: transcription initiation factor IIB, partial [Promethearchaeota archaeon]
PKDVKRCYRILIKELNLKSPSTEPIILVPRFIVELELNAEIENLTNQILETYKSKIFTSGKDPKGIVAGAIYLACKIKNKKVTQKEIVDIVGVTEVTLRSRFRELVRLLNINI